MCRYGAWHGVGLGALSLTGLPSTQIPFEPLVPGGVKVPNTNFYRAPVSTEDEVAFGMWAADEIERAIVREGPSSVAAVLLEPIQASGGCITPPPGYWKRVRDICDRHGVLLVSDDVICGFGRLGHAFGAQRYDYLPDMVTMTKGLTSGYAPLGALLAPRNAGHPIGGRARGVGGVFHSPPRRGRSCTGRACHSIQIPTPPDNRHTEAGPRRAFSFALPDWHPCHSSCFGFSFGRIFDFSFGRHVFRLLVCSAR